MATARHLLSLFVAAPIVLAVVAVSECFAEELAAPAPPIAPPTVRVTLSKETTRITKPLHANGYPDYIAAINELTSKGVTPETNASVLLWRAFGPKSIDAELREKFFHLLGIENLSEEGDYLVELDHVVKDHPELVKLDRQDEEEDGLTAREALATEHQKDACKRPWSAEEFPIVAAWLKANEAPLRLITASTQRAHRYEPHIAVDSPETVIGVLLPGTQQSRDAARLLVARAMLHAGSGKTDEAWKDLIACHRLANLAGEGVFLVDVLVCIAIHSIAFDAEHAVLQSQTLSADQLRQFRAERAANVKNLHVARSLDVGERWMFSDLYCVNLSQERPFGIFGMVEESASEDEPGWGEWLLSLIFGWRLNHDIVLKFGNGWYDCMVEIIKEPDNTKRDERLAGFDDSLRKLATGTKENLFKLMFFGLTQDVSEMVGGLYMSLLLPAVTASAQAEDRFETRDDIVDLGFALALYKHDHGRFPVRLEELLPKQLEELPQDRLGDGPLHYASDGKGYLLYSVGHNHIDDEGRTYDDAAAAIERDESTPVDWDDLSLRVPAGWRMK